MVTRVSKPTPQDFLYALVKNWASLVSGGLSVPFTILSIYSRNQNAKLIFALLSISGVFIASYKLWAQEREERIKNQDELEKMSEITGGLEITFEGDCKPYFEEQPLAVLPGGRLVDRRYRVGVRNTSRIVVSKARIVLENCEPNDAAGVHLGHPLQVMAFQLGTSEVSVQPSDDASVFFDVVHDETLDGKLRDDAFGLCYASSVKLFAIPRGSYILTLRVEGDAMQSRKKFRIFQESTTQMLTMREVAN